MHSWHLRQRQLICQAFQAVNFKWTPLGPRMVRRNRLERIIRTDATQRTPRIHGCFCKYCFTYTPTTRCQFTGNCLSKDTVCYGITHDNQGIALNTMLGNDRLRQRSSGSRICGMLLAPSDHAVVSAQQQEHQYRTILRKQSFHHHSTMRTRS